MGAEDPLYAANNGTNIGNKRGVGDPGTRNLRSVWDITTKPYKGAHFATFPPEIPERCIKAGTKTGDTVLDPFGGAGTTAVVAKRLGREFVIIELSGKYIEDHIKPRVETVGSLFNKQKDAL